MSEPFLSTYAEAYDTLYDEKDYESECDLLLDALGRFGATGIRSILDLGCGTGSHAISLSARGIEVVGVDRAADMVSRAEAKARLEAPVGRPEFHVADIRKVRLGRTFDAVLMMFAVLGYQRTNDDVLAALRTARAHLEPGGWFAFDVWYGPAVLHERPGERVKIVESNGRRIVRAAASRLDVAAHACVVDYRLWTFAGHELVDEATEQHVMRYFFPLELDLLLDVAGFTPVRLGRFPDVDEKPDSTSWNVLVLARAA